MPRKGFTLIELLVVIAIIGLLSALAIVALGGARLKARDARRVANLKTIQTALELYASDHNGTYPVTSSIALGDIDHGCLDSTGFHAAGGCTNPYLASIPRDPSSGYYTYSSTGPDYTVMASLEGTVNNISGSVSVSANSGLTKTVIPPIAISSGTGETLALKGDGTVWSWGYNNYGQLGINNTIDQTSPVQVLGLGGTGALSGMTAVSAGTYFSLALKSDGTVYAWGGNFYGMLGNNSVTNSKVPVQVVDVGGSGILSNVVAVSAGGDHSLALKSDGTVWAWGRNTYGQLGTNNITEQHAPVQVLDVGGSGNLSGIIAISAGNYFSLAIKSDGTVYAWGRNNSGQLGINNTTDQRFILQ